MIIELEENKPWLSQVKRLLYKTALDKANGNKTQAAKLLGCSVRTLRTEVKRDENLSEYHNPIKTYERNDKMIKLFFELGYSFTKLAKLFDTNRGSVARLLESIYGEKKCNEMNVQNKEKKKGDKMTNEEILSENRVILSEIAEKIRENKIDELTVEHAMFAKILFQNGFMTKTGEITEEGKNALYH